MEGETSQQMHTGSVQTPIALSSLHFESYYIPSTMHAVHGTLQPSDYQLRKVSSEPNLEMRIRAKLLNKSAGPLQSQTVMHQWILILVVVHHLQSLKHILLATSPHLIIPSPSLPNLTSPAQIPMDMSALLAQALYSPFFSTPSLIASNPLQPSFSMVDSGFNLNNTLSEGTKRNLMKFDTRNQNTVLSLGGYPSLLKQQLRDLVLRRKSLVREPEDETALEAQLLSCLQSGSVLSTQLKTVFWKSLVYDPAMAKHQCFCGNNKNHVEHGERVQSIWSRLQEGAVMHQWILILVVVHHLQSLKHILLATSPHLIIPSPSLPNLTSPAQIPMDMSALLAQALYSPFFSTPSLIASNPLQPSFSMVDSGFNLNNTLSEGTKRNLMKFDTRNQNTVLSLGGYPSLLKQQLRDLVLRRKSLVREPEDETALEAQLLSCLQSGSVLSTQLKTVFWKSLVYDPAMAKHQCFCGNNKNHVEHGERVQSIWSRLQEGGLVEKCERMEPSQLSVKSFVQKSFVVALDSDTYFNDASTQLAAGIAVGSLAELALQVVESRLRNGFACIRPPGHHAECNQAMGFCFLNNVAITCSRIAIIDWDVHHDNGTQICFEADASVLYLSLHDNGNFFPGTGAVTEVGVGSGKGYTVNIPFSSEMMDDADYLAAWRVIVAPVLNQFKPTFIIVSAGFDAACGHPQALGGYNLSPQLFGYFTQQLMN
uniref:histone deacetylase n=1 Tax=Wuchereria bancrofti TaxID=6293 RepID=A0AAF5PLJ8_WUCBA